MSKHNELLKEFGYARSEEHTSELQSPCNLVCRLLLEKKKKREGQTLQRLGCKGSSPVRHCARGDCEIVGAMGGVRLVVYGVQSGRVGVYGGHRCVARG